MSAPEQGPCAAPVPSVVKTGVAPKESSNSGNVCGSRRGVSTGTQSNGSKGSGSNGNSSGNGSGSSSGGNSRRNSLTARKSSSGGCSSGRHRGEAYIEGDIKLRFLCPDDVEAVKGLCREWFPVEYPDFWYKDITNDKRFFSLAAAINTTIVGLLVAEVKTRARCHREDSNILSATFPGSTQVAYILSLGVVEEYRRRGIASALLENFLASLTSQTSGSRPTAKAVYLHVLASNTGAIRFYEKHKFQRHEFLPYYYSIHGQAKDGLSYVLYINGGQPPWTLIDYMKHFGSYISRIQPCNLPHAMARHTRNFFAARRSWVHLPHLPNMPSMPNMPNINMPNITMPNILSRIRGQGSSSSSSAAGPSGSSSNSGAGDSSDSSSSSSAEAVTVVDDTPSVASSSTSPAPSPVPVVVTVPMTPHEAGESSGSSRRSWLPSINVSGMSLLTRFGGQCYDSGEQNEPEEPEEYTNADHSL
ncbi:uncharacterized protein [Diadema setosum]|uniref:uncharacterized protein n=1 Tax=Diadema setosum TaxID=31175 RepID=UPI003B3A3286